MTNPARPPRRDVREARDVSPDVRLRRRLRARPRPRGRGGRPGSGAGRGRGSDPDHPRSRTRRPDRGRGPPHRARRARPASRGRRRGLPVALVDEPTRCGACNGRVDRVSASDSADPDDRPEYVPDDVGTAGAPESEPDTADTRPAWRCRDCGRAGSGGATGSRSRSDSTGSETSTATERNRFARDPPTPPAWTASRPSPGWRPSSTASNARPCRSPSARWAFGDVALGLDPVERLDVYLTKDVIMGGDSDAAANFAAE